MKETDNLGMEKTLIDDGLVENYRNLQNRNYRNVFFFDSRKYCKESHINNIIDNKKVGTHVEKVKRKTDIFVFVPGEQPSGIPGSFLVSKDEAVKKGLENSDSASSYK